MMPANKKLLAPSQNCPATGRPAARNPASPSRKNAALPMPMAASIIAAWSVSNRADNRPAVAAPMKITVITATATDSVAKRNTPRAAPVLAWRISPATSRSITRSSPCNATMPSNVAVTTAKL